MTSNTARNTMTNATNNLLLIGLVSFLLNAGCGPEFDPASLITKTRVVGAKVEVEGAPQRATPLPGERVNVTWFVTSPDVTPPLGWSFAICAPGTSGIGCLAAPLERFDGTTNPPRLSAAVPPASALGGAASFGIYGQVCAGTSSIPEVDPQGLLPICTNAGRGTTVFLDVPLQQGDQGNHNPTADRAFTLDGAAWPPPAGDDPCVQGPRVAAGSKGHVIGNLTQGSDRERYALVLGAPPVSTPARERLQISQFTTAGELKSQFSFVESSDEDEETTVDVSWDAPDAAEIPTSGKAVTFTFVVRDDRGGADWTTRSLCVTP